MIKHYLLIIPYHNLIAIGKNLDSDTAVVSTGVNGVTGRHFMRLVNSRFGEETKFF